MIKRQAVILPMILGLFLMIASAVAAQEIKPAELPPILPSGDLVPYGGLDMLWALGAFALVMVTLYFSLKALGRLSRFQGQKGRESVFKLRGIQPLDNRKYLAAVEVEGRLIVVGVTHDRITPVANWFSDDGADQAGLDFTSAPTPIHTQPLDLKLPEEDQSNLNISLADLHRGSQK